MNCLPVILTLRCWNGLIDKFLKNAMCVFFVKTRNYLFLCIPIAISFRRPKTEDIDQLSFGI